MLPETWAPDAETDDYLVFDALVARFYEAEPETRVEVEIGARSHPGLVRDRNEDHYLVVRRTRQRDVVVSNLPEGLLGHHEQHAYTIAVADGMGGHRHGDLASLMALQTGWYLGGNEVKWTLKVNERETEELQRKAEVFFQLINQSMRLEGMGEPRLMGMGTTLTVCYTTGPELFVLHAGDSRAYLHRGGSLEMLTRDHTVSQKLIDSGMAEPGSPEEKRKRHVLTSSLGTDTKVTEVGFRHERLRDGDTLLVCSDGLTDMVEDERIAEVLGSALTPDEAAGRLQDLALEAGGRDNITVVVVRYRFRSRRDTQGLADTR